MSSGKWWPSCLGLNVLKWESLYLKRWLLYIEMAPCCIELTGYKVYFALLYYIYILDYFVLNPGPEGQLQFGCFKAIKHIIASSTGMLSAKDEG